MFRRIRRIVSLFLPSVTLSCLLGLPLFGAAAQGVAAGQEELMRAVNGARLDRIRELVEQGVPIRPEMMVIAVGKGRTEVVRLLIDLGFPVDVGVATGPDDSDLILTPLGIAVGRGDLEVARILIEAGADVKATHLDSPLVPLAADRGRIELLELLASAGADLDAPGMLGRTGLHMAAQKKNFSVAQRLLQLGASVDRTDDLGQTPLFVAAQAGSVEVAQALIEAGADLEAGMPNGMRPLMAAVSGGDTRMVAFLVGAGADVDAETADGNRAIDYSRGVDEVEQLLQQSSGMLRENRQTPRIREDGTYIPARYTPPCESSGAPPKEVSCGQEGVEKLTMSVVEGPGVRASVLPPRCEPVTFEEMGSYTVRVTRSTRPWKVGGCYQLRQTTGEGRELLYIRREEGTISTETINVAIAEKASSPPEADEEEPPEITILSPDEDAEFTFTSGEEGYFEIHARAEVTPERYADQIEWDLEKTGNAEVKIEPERGPDVIIRVTGLPERNSDFGIKKLTARVAGYSDQRQIKVFFSPEARNHPGEGKGETPNWFYYWKQTSAAGGNGDHLEYQSVLAPVNRPGDSVLGRHQPTDDRIYLSDLVMETSVCTRRTAAGQGAKDATGIDCFGELVRHEARHRFEWHSWWLAGTNQLTRFFHQLAEDRDADNVPAWVEENEAGCSDHDQFSCANRPTFSTEPRTVPDTELYAYYEGWKWVIGSADDEDWSYCGKQWTLTECK